MSDQTSFRQWLNLPLGQNSTFTSGLDTYFDAMVANGYDGMEILTTLTENEVPTMFEDIGMTKRGHQIMLVKKIAAAKSPPPQTPEVSLPVPAGEAELFGEVIEAPPQPRAKQSRDEEEVPQRKRRKKVNLTEAEECLDLGVESGGHRYGRKYTSLMIAMPRALS